MPQNQRVMPDWAYDKAPKFREFFSGLNEMMTRPTPSTGISPADMVINQTPFGAIRDLESLYNNGLPQLPPTFQDAMGSDAGKAVSYGMAGMAGLGALLPMMRKTSNPLLTPSMAEFEQAAPSAFRPQAGAPDMPIDPNSVIKMLQQQGY